MKQSQGEQLYKLIRLFVSLRYLLANMHIVALIPPVSIPFLDQIFGKFVSEMLCLAEGIPVIDSSYDPPQERTLFAYLLRVLCDLPAKKKVCTEEL